MEAVLGAVTIWFTGLKTSYSEENVGISLEDDDRYKKNVRQLGSSMLAGHNRT